MKKSFSLLLLAMLLIMVSGCNDAKEKETLPFSDLLGKINLPSDLKERESMDASKIARQFGFSDESFLNYSYFLPDSSVSAKEILFLEYKPEAGKGIIEALEQYKEAQIAKWKDYAPDAAHLIQKGVIAEEQPYILFAIHEEVDDVIGSFYRILE